MTYANDATANLLKLQRRDDAKKAQTAARFPAVVAAMDTYEFAALTNDELCAKMLQGFGKPVPKDVDPAMALDFYVAGLQQGAQGRSGMASGMDSAVPEGSILHKYLTAE